jgi:hypothetical protein
MSSVDKPRGVKDASINVRIPKQLCRMFSVTKLSLDERYFVLLRSQATFVRKTYLADPIYPVNGNVCHGFITIGLSALAERIVS